MRVENIGYCTKPRLADNFIMITIFSIILMKKVIVFLFAFRCWDKAAGSEATVGGKILFD